MNEDMDGAALIAAERARQSERENYTPEHDDHHADGSLALAAVCYAAPERVFVMREFAAGVMYRDPWPWEERADRRHYPGTNVVQPAPNRAARVRELVKAGALIAAEIDRLRRAEGNEP